MTAADTQRMRVSNERERLGVEYERRRLTIDPARYAAWQPAAIFERAERTRVAARLLHAADRFPGPLGKCLEIGCGSGGWLPDLVRWGVEERALSGIELDPVRALAARRLLPCADVRVGDATALGWPDGTFGLTVISTVFSSILDDEVRRLVANEATRVTAPGGAILWYDLAVNNPANRQVRRVAKRELTALFPGLPIRSRSITLAPPLARLVAPHSWLMTHALEALPWLRTHLLAVIAPPRR